MSNVVQNDIRPCTSERNAPSLDPDCDADPYPSLSDFHDYEPNLEFDDSDLLQSKHPEHEGPDDLNEVEDDKSTFLESPMTDGTIEEDFEAALSKDTAGGVGNGLNRRDSVKDGRGGVGGVWTSAAGGGGGSEENFSDIASRGIIEVVGDDDSGCKVVVISACRFPCNKSFDHAKFLRYLTHTLDGYVNFDYSLVYFHHGLTSRNKPPLRWMWDAYKALERPYKKNLKALFLVHPTNFIRVVWNFFRPIISVKFGRKVQYVNYLNELQKFMDVKQLPIPKQVLEHDRKLMSKLTYSPSTSGDGDLASPLPTQQFGVSLDFIKANQGTDFPPVVTACVGFLSTPECLETEGIFRRAARATRVKEMQSQINNAAMGDVTSAMFGEPSQDVHLAAVLLKAFFRDLPDPLFTYDAFDDVMKFEELPPDVATRTHYIRKIVRTKLPQLNVALLKYLVDFLSMVIDSSCLNKMTALNLAVVFGPNLIRSRDQSVSLPRIAAINSFTEHLLSHSQQIFVVG